jgi:hypothetical protein
MALLQPCVEISGWMQTKRGREVTLKICTEYSFTVRGGAAGRSSLLTYHPTPYLPGTDGVPKGLLAFDEQLRRRCAQLQVL